MCSPSYVRPRALTANGRRLRQRPADAGPVNGGRVPSPNGKDTLRSRRAGALTGHRRAGGPVRAVGRSAGAGQAATGVVSAVRALSADEPLVNRRSRPKAPEPVKTSRNMAQQYMAAPSPLFWIGHSASGWWTLKYA